MNVLRTKVVLVGDSKVGKSNIINSVVKQNFQALYLTTLGIEYSTYEMKVKDTNYTLLFNILDATGFSIFRDLVNTQVKDVNFIIYCFDVTNKESFNSIKLWKESLKEYVQNKKCVEILVGNKIDLEKKVVVSENDIKGLANQYNMKYFLVSALAAKNILNPFTYVMETVYTNYINFVTKVKAISN